MPASSELPSFSMDCVNCGRTFEIEYVTAVAAGYLPFGRIECPACGHSNRRQFLDTIASRFPDPNRPSSN